MVLLGTLAEWLVALGESALGRILLGIGIGWLTFSGTEVAVDQVKEQVQGAWNGLPAAAAALASMAGFDVAFGILLGAYVARATMSALPKLGKLTSGG